MKEKISETMKQVKQVRKEIWRECLKESYNPLDILDVDEKKRIISQLLTDELPKSQEIGSGGEDGK